MTKKSKKALGKKAGGRKRTALPSIADSASRVEQLAAAMVQTPDAVDAAALNSEAAKLEAHFRDIRLHAKQVDIGKRARKSLEKKSAVQLRLFAKFPSACPW